MAQTMVVGAALGGLFQGVSQIIAPLIQQKIGLIWGVHDEVKKLSRTLLRIQAMLNDAESRQPNEEAVKLWLSELKNLAYDVEDIVDEMETEHLRLKVEGEIRRESYQVSNLWSSLTNKVSFPFEIAPKLEEVLERLDEIGNDGEALGLRKGVAGRLVETRDELQTSSLIDKSLVFGREEDKEKMIELLVGNECGESNVSVIPIVGMGGVGKTTLAQLVYNDERVERHFELRMWVCVSEDFNVRRITKSIIESATGARYDLLDLDPTQRRVQELMSTKRFLLILDDVWNENSNSWESLQVPFKVGAEGSKIIVTTRSRIVASIVGTNLPHSLDYLSDEDSWLLFKQRAFPAGFLVCHKKLEEIGKEIVKKCKGLPLAAKTLGGLLSSKRDESEWENILKSEIWDLPEDKNAILPALRLSYNHLPTNLKQCFAYCSIFPKDYEFKKDQLVLLWMAAGFVQPRGRTQMEARGGELFDDLHLRSFFHFSHSDDEGSIYKMHDLIHDLAESVASGECFHLENDKSYSIPDSARHFLLLWYSIEPVNWEILSDFKSLRTFLLQNHVKNSVEKIPHDLFLKLSFLRVLDLSNTQIQELPISVGCLKHLRYLDLSSTRIERFPESASSLYNLQTLKLLSCVQLVELPRGTSNLSKLRHLFLDPHLSFNLASMPPRIGKLTHLQTLSKFVVGNEDGCGIQELRDMMELQGWISICNLENVRNAAMAEEANLKNKQHLHQLELEWSYDKYIFRDGVDEVLEALQPHTNLKRIIIRCYDGVSLPSWIQDLKLSNLVNINLYYFRKCKVLPPLGQLPFLKYLAISGMDELERVGREFSGHGEIKGFPSLETFSMMAMDSLMEWSGVDEGEFSCLRHLSLRRCPKLNELPCYLPPTLTKLTIRDCKSLISFPRFPSLCHLQLNGCNKMLMTLPLCLNGLLQPLAALKKLEIQKCDDLVSLPGDADFQGLVSLEELEISSFRELQSLSDIALPTSLKSIYISSCRSLASLPKGLRDLSSLQELKVHACPRLLSLPDNGLPSTLQSLQFWFCPALNERYKRGGEDWPKIAHVPNICLD